MLHTPAWAFVNLLSIVRDESPLASESESALSPHYFEYTLRTAIPGTVRYNRNTLLWTYINESAPGLLVRQLTISIHSLNLLVRIVHTGLTIIRFKTTHTHYNTLLKKMPGLTTFLISAVSLTSFTLASPIAQLVGRDTALQSSYDYVIVGGGTSGLIVADRLTENQSSLFPELWIYYAQLLIVYLYRNCPCH